MGDLVFRVSCRRKPRTPVVMVIQSHALASWLIDLETRVTLTGSTFARRRFDEWVAERPFAVEGPGDKGIVLGVVGGQSICDECASYLPGKWLWLSREQWAELEALDRCASQESW